MPKIAATTLAQTEGVDPNVITQRLLVMAEEVSGKIPPEEFKKAVAQMNAERTSDSEVKYAQVNFFCCASGRLSLTFAPNFSYGECLRKCKPFH
ncbi:hypothetical protein [Okeania sp. SIO1I7]|uniref:hypothetical protein n=1 Tax=Okeania sp. SIO1I7 TaxID=2607772 RepID=UPI0013F6A947|nr:hypothetical protein [Okeania sp. SIO1I7]NET30323.1 hypothetical protein [Okeania sp. SIO1I7]